MNFFNFNEFLGESAPSWEEIFRKAKTRAVSGKFGLSKIDPLSEVALMIEKGKIYDNTVPGYPFILAISGTGDDYGNDDAWLIKDKADFYRWISTVSPGNKMFPDFSGNGYMDHPSEWDAETIKVVLQEISTTDNNMDDFQNGYRVDFFTDEEQMKDYSTSTLECGWCEGEGKDEDGEECENCEGSGSIDTDDLETPRVYYDIADGSIFPPREVTTNW
jgi:hypothetical protein